MNNNIEPVSQPSKSNSQSESHNKQMDQNRSSNIYSMPDQNSSFAMINKSQDGEVAIDATKEKELISYNHLTYALYLVSFFMMGLLCIVPIIMSYAKRHDAKYSWLATHFDWQIKTFWYSLLMGMVGIFLLFISVGGIGISILAESSMLASGSVVMTLFGGFLLVFSAIWYLYRIIRGWIALSDKRPVP